MKSMKKIYTLAYMAATLIAAGVQAQQFPTAATNTAEGRHGGTTDGPRGGIANDDCSSAQLIYMVPPNLCAQQATDGDNTGASEGYVESTCEPFPFSGPDVWYKFHSGNHNMAGITVTPTTTQGRDWGFVMYESCDGAEVACGMNSSAAVNVAIQPGKFYYIQVYSNLDYGAAGTFRLCVRYSTGITAPVNDGCPSTPSALSIGTPLTFTGTTVGATIDNDFAAGSYFYGKHATVWHAFTTSACTDLTIDYCGTAVAPEPTWAILSTTCPGNYEVLTGDLATPCTNGSPVLNFEDVPAGTYYLPVLSEYPAAYGPYTIQVAASACSGLGVETLDHATWSIHPNPGNGDFTVRTSTLVGNASIELFDLTGRKVYTEKAFLGNGTEHLLPLEGQLAKGAYMLRISGEMGTTSKRVMVE